MSHPLPPKGDQPVVPEGYFTADQLEAARREAIEQARKEERDKLYPQRDKQKEALEAMQVEVKTLREAEAARAKEADKAAAAAEKARKAAAEAELSAKDLIAKRQSEWEQQLAAAKAEQQRQIDEMRQQRELDQAVFAKEREMNALQNYIRDRVEAERDNIAPELLDFIDGTTQEGVEASITRVKEKTAAIVEGMRQAQQQQRAGMPGVAPSGGATALTPGIDTGDRKFSADDIKGMSMKDFADLRKRMSMNNGGGQGIFA